MTASRRGGDGEVARHLTDVEADGRPEKPFAGPASQTVGEHGEPEGVHGEEAAPGQRAHRHAAGNGGARVARPRGVQPRALTAGGRPQHAGRDALLASQIAPAQQHEGHRGGVVDQIGHRH